MGHYHEYFTVVCSKMLKYLTKNLFSSKKKKSSESTRTKLLSDFSTEEQTLDIAGFHCTPQALKKTRMNKALGGDTPFLTSFRSSNS